MRLWIFSGHLPAAEFVYRASGIDRAGTAEHGLPGLTEEGTHTKSGRPESYEHDARVPA